MSKKFDLKLNYKNVGRVLKSKEMLSICKEHANRIQSRAGEGYEAKARIKGTRCYSLVEAVTYEAKKDNAENNTLLKAVK